MLNPPTFGRTSCPHREKFSVEENMEGEFENPVPTGEDEQMERIEKLMRPLMEVGNPTYIVIGTTIAGLIVLILLVKLVKKVENLKIDSQSRQQAKSIAEETLISEWNKSTTEETTKQALKDVILEENIIETTDNAYSEEEFETIEQVEANEKTVRQALKEVIFEENTIETTNNAYSEEEFETIEQAESDSEIIVRYRSKTEEVIIETVKERETVSEDPQIDSIQSPLNTYETPPPPPLPHVPPPPLPHGPPSTAKTDTEVSVQKPSKKKSSEKVFNLTNDIIESIKTDAEFSQAGMMRTHIVDEIYLQALQTKTDLSEQRRETKIAEIQETEQKLNRIGIVAEQKVEESCQEPLEKVVQNQVKRRKSEKIFNLTKDIIESIKTEDELSHDGMRTHVVDDVYLQALQKKMDGFTPKEESENHLDDEKADEIADEKADEKAESEEVVETFEETTVTVTTTIIKEVLPNEEEREMRKTGKTDYENPQDSLMDALENSISKDYSEENGPKSANTFPWSTWSSWIPVSETVTVEEPEKEN